MNLEQSKHIEIICLYDSDGELFHKPLSDHLVGLRRKGLINEKDRTRAGQDYEKQMKQSLEESQVIILLMTRNFHASSYYSGREMVDLIKNCSEKGIHIWPIIAKPVYWESTNFHEYEVFFGKEKSINSYANVDEACTLIVEKISVEVALMLAEAWVLEGNTYRHQLELDKACDAYKKSFSYVPSYSHAILEKGRTLRKQNKFEEARQCFEMVTLRNIPVQQKSKNTDSNYEKANFMLTCDKGYAYLEMGRLPQAHEMFQEVYNQIISPTSYSDRTVCAEAYCGEGDVCLQLSGQTSQPMNSLQQALDAYKYAETFAVQKQKYTAKIGKIYRIMGDSLSYYSQSKEYYEQSLSKYEQIIDQYPTYASAYVGQGDALYLLYRFEEALVAYEKALSLDQFDAGAHGGRGWLLLRNKNIKEALNAFEKALFLENDSAGYHYGKGCALSSLQQYQKALDAYDDARKRGFDATGLIFQRATALVALGDEEHIYGHKTQAGPYYTQAISLYTSALKWKVGKVDIIYYGLGRAYFGLSDWQNAYHYYQKVIDCAPYKADGYLGLGKTLFELGNISEASTHFKHAYNCCHRPDSTVDEADIQIAYGDAYYRLAGEPGGREYYERLEKARTYYETAIKVHEHAIAYAGLGKTHAALYNYQEAITILHQALMLKPQFAECYFVAGNCCYELNQPSEAYSLYEKAIVYGFDNASVRNAQGNALLAMKNYMRAKGVFQDVIEHMQEGIAYAYYGKGLAFHALKMIEEALQAFEMANQLDSLICSRPECRQTLEEIHSTVEGMLRNNPYDCSAYKHKGDTLLLLKDRTKEALEAYKRSIQYGNRSAGVYFCCGEVYCMLHDYRSAIRDYNRALDIDPNHQYAKQRKKIIEIVLNQKKKNFMKRIASIAGIISHI